MLGKRVMKDTYDYALGTYSRAVSTGSTDAQLWFDRGLIWCYGYHHEESEVCFRRAADADPNCAMAHWGIAYVAGPNYNKPWEVFDEKDLVATLRNAYQAAQSALQRAPSSTPVEQALIGALARRYHSDHPVDDFSIWNDDYANAMREVYGAFPDDMDVCTLFAEALMNRTPWDLWNLDTGEPTEGADTAEAIEVLERALAKNDELGFERHPGLLHMYIHLMEMSPHPERALVAGDRLRGLVPDAGHLEHMPTHIDVQCGDYLSTVLSNSDAIVADRKYLEREGAINFYSGYRVHNYHFKVFGAMLLGHYGAAMEGADELVETVPEELLRLESPPMADFVESYVSIRMHAMIRFGRWQDIIDEPMPVDRDLYCNTVAINHYAKTVAHAATGDVAAAERESAEFQAAMTNVPESRMLFNNTCNELLVIAHEMQRGEIEYRKGNYDTAFKHLRKSVELDDGLPYSEPWGWMQPTRHALGALLLEQNHMEEATAVYRADLGLDDSLRRAMQHMENVWSLHGLHECLVRLGRHDEAAMLRPRLNVALARADVPIKSSCFCRLHQAA